MAKRTRQPKPQVVTTVCSECGLDWRLHGSDPTTNDCIRLLKAELARRIIPTSYPVPVPYPVRPYRPIPWTSPVWGGGITCQSNSEARYTVNTRTPRAIESTCSAVTS